MFIGAYWALPYFSHCTYYYYISFYSFVFINNIYGYSRYAYHRSELGSFNYCKIVLLLSLNYNYYARCYNYVMQVGKSISLFENKMLSLHNVTVLDQNLMR